MLRNRVRDRFHISRTKKSIIATSRVVILNEFNEFFAPDHDPYRGLVLRSCVGKFREFIPQELENDEEDPELENIEENLKDSQEVLGSDSQRDKDAEAKLKLKRERKRARKRCCMEGVRSFNKGQVCSDLTLTSKMVEKVAKLRISEEKCGEMVRKCCEHPKK